MPLPRTRNTDPDWVPGGIFIRTVPSSTGTSTSEPSAASLIDSEIATGYCTLYGDMAGGLAVISDVPKTLVYKLAREINRERAVIPEATLTKAPSTCAERRAGKES